MKVTMWRCTKCGTWSHAKRKPTRHIQCKIDLHDDDVKAINDAGDLMSDGYDFIPGQYEGGEQRVTTYRCGPFEEWVAEKVTTYEMPGESA